MRLIPNYCHLRAADLQNIEIHISNPTFAKVGLGVDLPRKVLSWGGDRRSSMINIKINYIVIL